MVWVPFGKEDFGRNRYAFLFVDDDSGKPIYLHHSQSKIHLKVLDDGSIEKM